MSFTSINSSLIQVGKALKKELFDLIKGNLDDLNDRVDALSIASGPVVLFNEEFENISDTLTLTGIRYFKAFANMQITKAQIQIFTKDGISSGVIDFDLKKSSTLNGTFATIFTTKPTFNYASGVDYGSADGVFNAGQTVAQNSYIRLDITNVPSGVVVQKIRVFVYGVIS